MSGQRYLVTARKYRPQTFGEVVAQEHVAETLKNAIRLDRLAHAYLFSGPRGVGKTTAARILAKAINCTTPPEEREDAAEPCRACESCRTFEEGRSLSIIEIDAASNRRIDDIRELRDTVRIPPQGNRKKVYIVDEVHMLTNEAFNALLKTLEEPPPYVLFIFATTEPHKVLPTILSRCQRFDFRRIAVPEIVSRLAYICAEEQIQADEASLMLIARKGDGALRDALSAFDQAVSLCGTKLVYAELAPALGVVDVDLFFQATECMANRDSAGVLRLVDHLVRSGYDLQEFLAGLAEHLRNLLVAHTVGDTSLIEATEATRQRYAVEAERFAETDLLRLLMVVGETQAALHNSTQPRLKLETGLLKLAGLARAADLRQALEKLERLEALAREGKLSAGVTGSGERGAGGGKGGAESGEPSTPPQRTSTIHRMPRPDGSVRPTAPSADEDGTGEEKGHEPEADEASPAPARLPPHRDGEVREPASSRPTSYPSLFGAPALTLAKAPGNARSAPPNEPSALFAGSGALATMPAPSAAPTQERHFERICEAWPLFVGELKSRQIRLGALLAQGMPLSAKGDVLVVGVPDDFHRRALQGEEARLLKHLTAMVDDGLAGLHFIVHRDPPAKTSSAPAPETDPAEYMRRRREEDPVVRAIFDQFGGEIVW